MAKEETVVGEISGCQIIVRERSKPERGHECELIVRFPDQDVCVNDGKFRDLRLSDHDKAYAWAVELRSFSSTGI